LGKPITANIITLGVISALTDIFSQEELLKAILSRVPKESEGLNKRAFHEGIKLVNRDA
jgi:2-oxoglutarate ferredoxin oxidoreductase subunit gamma